MCVPLPRFEANHFQPFSFLTFFLPHILLSLNMRYLAHYSNTLQFGEYQSDEDRDNSSSTSRNWRVPRYVCWNCKKKQSFRKIKKRKRIKEDVISKSFHYCTGPGRHEQTTKINSRGELVAFTRKTLWYVPSFSLSYPFFHSP